MIRSAISPRLAMRILRKCFIEPAQTKQENGKPQARNSKRKAGDLSPCRH
jgi:hypothetical protein